MDHDRFLAGRHAALPLAQPVKDGSIHRAELGGRTRNHCAFLISDPRIDLSIRQRGIDLLICLLTIYAGVLLVATAGRPSPGGRHRGCCGLCRRLDVAINLRTITCLANSGIFTYLTSYCFYAFHTMDDLVKYLCTHPESEGKFLDTKLGLVGLAPGGILPVQGRWSRTRDNCRMRCSAGMAHPLPVGCPVCGAEPPAPEAVSILKWR
jgi:hypothetical protein